MNKIAVVIIVFNGEHWLHQCLQSVCGKESLDVYIYENNSSDRSKEIILEYKKLSFTHFSKQNIGFGPANNFLMNEIIKRDNYSYCLLLNQDAWLLPNSIKLFNELLPSFKDYSIICPLHLSKDEQKLDNHLEEYILNEGLNSIIDQFPNTQPLNIIYDIGFTNAAAWFVKIDDLKKIGGFDPLFFYTGEDMDYAARIKYLGFRMGITPKVSIVHDKYLREPLLPGNNFKYHASHKADLLIRIKSLSKSSLVAYFSGLKFLLKHIVISIGKAQLWRLKLNCNLLIYLVMNIRLFESHRSKSKKPNGAFLNTEH